MPIDKEAKYDRQLRLWATTGQSNLEKSHICLINATSTGSEILKNLILPGIGNFTIIDDRKVTKENLSSNFFLKNQDLQKDLASAVQKNLNELNHDVRGYSLVRSLPNILANEPDSFWDQFNVVIVSDHTANLESLIALLWAKQIPLFIVNTIGFYGSFNIISNETTVIETHDPSKLYDLRIGKPWPELQEFADSFDLDLLSDQEHSHVPYIVIFIKALDSWRLSHNGQAPVTYSDKKQFRAYVQSLSRNFQLETNFIDADAAHLRPHQKTEIPDSIKQLIKINDERQLTSKTSIFWIFIAALKRFLIRNDNLLPLPGTLPDMASDTDNYIKLQKIYHDRAVRDQKLFTEEVYNILASIGRSKSEAGPDAIASFCKNARLLFATVGSKDLINSSLIDQFDLEGRLDLEEKHQLAIYFGILTFNWFVDKHNKKPSIEDYPDFLQLYHKKISPVEIDPNTENIFKEVISHNSTNYHNLSSLMGGIVSQEVLKSTTAQYIPLDNLFVFDGVQSKSERFKI
ncbi:NEDD8-activating enzyme E1 regulatory subunit [Candida viswanathii]|uniref:NEDD8-activating enzyme E1 regulatory subunit n=1 Tax=Candida viswanathii TaxID=5486 RepID=A0A367XXN5_9ASCO|nr:NEDD8-activating enzyme E1 regulatory subunit [Candida viswanathii]